MGLWTLMAPFALMALGTGLQVGTPDPSERTAIEQALIEYVCSGTAAGDTGAYHACLSAKLLQLRADFGRDLSRLSSAERKALDSACSRIREARGREAYVACLNVELVSLSNRRKPATPAPSEAAALPSPSASAPPARAPAPPASLRSSGLWIGAALAAVFVAAGGGLLAVKARRAQRKCRVCGGDVSDLGDLCQTCRHEAAEGVRRAATARGEEQRAHEEEHRRQLASEEEQRQQRARREEESQQQQQAQVRQREEEARLRQEEEARQQEEAARYPTQAAAGSEELFDPYVVLGVPRDASPEVIRAAYQGARAKYDANQVAHLSNELQEHYREKGQAVERAYEMLAT